MLQCRVKEKQQLILAKKTFVVSYILVGKEGEGGGKVDAVA